VSRSSLTGKDREASNASALPLVNMRNRLAALKLIRTVTVSQSSKYDAPPTNAVCSGCRAGPAGLNTR
jgi:hypothetical protein